MSLLSTPLLNGLPDETVAAFLTRVSYHTHPRGSRVFSEGDPGDRVLILLSGKVKVTRSGPVLLTMVGPGELLGELCLFDASPRQATATAVQEGDLCSIPAPAMLAWLEAHPCASLRMMRLLAERVRTMNDRFEDASGVDVATRVARVLVEQGGRFGRATRVGVRIRLDLSQDDLAHHVRASRERVNQILGDFSRRGWIRRDGAELVVLDGQRLTGRARYRPESARRRPTLPQ
ncbi:Crp/Fnr family transcriptional regulator [Nonomuraea sp. NPDC050556]|uniref:Crp/Fnr family transcriptional regulator n=1 Tax=Nonomuraea sp. NPDC050556 TaxID=3364369 RepID=UPI0037BB4252